jgi:hypothetical protein
MATFHNKVTTYALTPLRLYVPLPDPRGRWGQACYFIIWTAMQWTAIGSGESVD